MGGPKVVEFPRGSAADIPGGLRNLADLIEHGATEYVEGLTGVVALAWVTQDEAGNIEVGGLGQGMNRLSTVGLAMAGANILSMKKDAP